MMLTILCRFMEKELRPILMLVWLMVRVCQEVARFGVAVAEEAELSLLVQAKRVETAFQWAAVV
jgi:hypothetical protein